MVIVDIIPKYLELYPEMPRDLFGEGAGEGQTGRDMVANQVQLGVPTRIQSYVEGNCQTYERSGWTSNPHPATPPLATPQEAIGWPNDTASAPLTAR